MSIAPVALVAEKRHGAKVSLAVIRLHQLASWSWCRCGTQTLPAEKPIAAKPSWSKDTEPECETGVTIWCLPLLLQQPRSVLCSPRIHYDMTIQPLQRIFAEASSTLPKPLKLIPNMQNTYQRKNKQTNKKRIMRGFLFLFSSIEQKNHSNLFSNDC